MLYLHGISSIGDALVPEALLRWAPIGCVRHGCALLAPLLSAPWEWSADATARADRVRAMLRAVLAAHASSLDASRVTLVGVSNGAVGALVLAAEEPSVGPAAEASLPPHRFAGAVLIALGRSQNSRLAEVPSRARVRAHVSPCISHHGRHGRPLIVGRLSRRGYHRAPVATPPRR